MNKIEISMTTLVVTIAVATALIITAFASGYVIGQNQSKPSASTFTFVDDYGRTVALSGLPQRIVSVAPTPTEILFAVGAGDLVIGVDDFSDYPEETANITKVGNYELNVETIVSLNPDLIVSSDLVPTAQLDTLHSHGIPYMILAARTLDDVYKDIKLIGSITNHSTEANDIVGSLQDRVTAVTSLTLAENVSKPRVYIEYWPMWTFGTGSFGDDLIELAGGTNIAGNETQEYLEVSNEFVVSQNPEIVVYTIGIFTTTTDDDIKTRPGWSVIDAVSDDMIFTIDDNLISRYGPRLIDALEQLAEIIHPELFD